MPMFAVASALQARGHQVGIFASAGVGLWAAQADLPFFAAPDRCYSVEPCFVEELTAVLNKFHPDVLVDGMMPLGTRLVAEIRGVPQASMCVVGCPFTSVDLFPYGWGQRPPVNALERSMMRVAHAELEQTSAPQIRRWDALRVGLGLPPRGRHPWFEPPSQWLIVIPTTEAFEYPRSDLPTQAHFVGPVFWDSPSVHALPLIPDTARPLVFVSQGSTFTRELSILRLALAALADEPIQLVVSTGRHCRPDELGPLPQNAIVARQVPHRVLFPKLDLAITHGGFSSVHCALLHGVPLIVLPFAADQPENGQRVAQAGAGLLIDVEKCTPEMLRQAVYRVLRDPAFRQNARRVQASFAQHDGPRETAELLERLGQTCTPVLRRSDDLNSGLTVMRGQAC
jgi:MGT family glycosyltransferase